MGAKMWARWLLCCGWFGVASVAFGQESPPVVESPESLEERRYGFAAAAVDLSLMGTGVALFIREEEGVSGPLAEHGSVGMGLFWVYLAWWGTDSYRRGSSQRGPSEVGLRAKSMGLGAVFGLGVGISAGTRLTLVCVAGGGFCPLAYMYGLVFGPTIGAVAGLGYGMVQDYRTLARRPIKSSKVALVRVQPVLGLAPEGRIQLGLSGAF